MNEFKKDGNYIYINVPYAEAYIPTDLFSDSKSSVSYFYGDAIRTLGIFHMRFYKSDEEDRESVPLRTLKYPNTIETHPTSYTTEKLTLDGIEDDYYVLSYYMGDILMDSRTDKSILNCEAFMDDLIKAKLPNTLNYQDLLFYWLKNLKTNAIDPGTKAIIEQLIISENCRYAKDPKIPYRKIAATSDTLKPEDYVIYNMNNEYDTNSVLSGISCERVKDKLATSITMSMKDTKQNVSPLEKVLLM